MIADRAGAACKANDAACVKTDLPQGVPDRSSSGSEFARLFRGSGQYSWEDPVDKGYPCGIIQLTTVPPTAGDAHGRVSEQQERGPAGARNAQYYSLGDG